MSAAGCCCFLLVLALGDCTSLGNLFAPVLKRTTVTRSVEATPGSTANAPLSDRYYWLDKLKDTVFKTISPGPPFNKEIYYAIHTAPFYVGPNLCTTFGDIVSLASGYLMRDSKGNWIFCEDRCASCPACSDSAMTKQLRWTVKRIRHRDEGKTYRYDLQFNVSPVTEKKGGRRARSDVGHVYYSVKDSQPPVLEKPRKEDYLLDADDYDVQEYNEVRDRSYRKFAEFYRPGFIVKVDSAHGGRHVVHDVPFLTEAPALPSFAAGYPGSQHSHLGPGNSDFLKTYPEYYNVVYNEVLRALMANDNLWRGLATHHGKQERCTQNEPSALRNPGATTGKHLPMRKRVIEIPDSRIERVAGSSKSELANWTFIPTVQKVGDWALIPTVQKHGNTRNEEAMPSAVMESTFSRNSTEDRKAEKEENREKGTASSRYNSIRGNVSRAMIEEREVDNLETTTLETINMENNSMSIANLSTKANENSSETEYPASIERRESENAGEADLQDRFPKTIDEGTNSGNKSDPAAELKLYKNLLKQLALSVISQEEVFENNSMIKGNVQTTTAIMPLQRSERMVTERRRSHRDDRVLENPFMAQ